MAASKDSLIVNFFRSFSSVWAEKEEDGRSGGFGAILRFRVKASEYEGKSKNQPEIKEDMSKDEIIHLRQTDPFMYYSHPSLRRAAMTLEDVGVDPSSLAATASVRRRNTAPADPKRRKRSNVRRTCISVEAHPTLILDEDLWNELCDE